MFDIIVEYMVYAVIIAWSSMITYFVTKRKVSKERTDTVAQEAETSIIEKQNVAFEKLYTQNTRINSALEEFQEEIIKLHKETLALRAENTALKFEVCQLQAQIELLVKVNESEKSFTGH
ncbi:hypothetical protein UFOVP116_283 [uncultured Caudovirales phage]|uniref:Uncharacterized protein n=1 Tax=uncultured Caudovirales phage TaxID=2100421 RepID=A0A6J5LAR0_9CAUD|nr:hypothetical protein UFOVP116_283 [uncultured Caudovirales phage]